MNYKNHFGFLLYNKTNKYLNYVKKEKYIFDYLFE